MTSARAALRTSAGLLRARPIGSLALGAAVVLSLLSVSCGIGLLTTPWFLCELFALQLSQLRGAHVQRSLAFVPAGLVMLGAVLLVSAAAGLSLVDQSPDMPAAAGAPLGVRALVRSAGAYAVAASAVALLFILPYLYSPLLLIERGGGVAAAILESARIVAVRGVPAALRLSLAAHLLQAAPLALALVVAGAFPGVPSSVLVLSSLLLLFATVPLGQGMIVSAYVSALPAAPARDTPLDAGEQQARRALGRLALLWTGLSLAPLLSLLLLGASLLRPSGLAPGAAPVGVQVAAARASARARCQVLPDTALQVCLDARAVTITASDGGGVGRLPLRAPAMVTGVRVVRVRDLFAVEVAQGRLRSTTWIDRAGVRQDDDLRARLLDRAPFFGLMLVFVALLSSALLTVPALAGLARVHRGFGLPPEARPQPDVLALDLATSRRRAYLLMALLLPLWLAAAHVAGRALG